MSQEELIQNRPTQPEKFPYKEIIKKAWKQSWKNFKFHKIGIGVVLLISGVFPLWNPLNLGLIESNDIFPVQYLLSQHEVLLDLLPSSFLALLIFLLLKIGVRFLFTLLGLRSLLSAFREMNNVFKKEFHIISLTNPDESEPYKPQTKKNIRRVWFSLFWISMAITTVVTILQWHLSTISTFYFCLQYLLNFISSIVVLILMYVTIDMYHYEETFHLSFKKIINWFRKYLKEIIITQFRAYLMTFAIGIILGIIIFVLIVACTLPMTGGQTAGFASLVRAILILLSAFYISGIIYAFRFAINCLTYQQLDIRECTKEEPIKNFV